jgi:HAD superfamily hydrolase (TIGR01509 family)
MQQFSSHHATRAILWDLDVTLVDTMIYHFRAWCETLTAEGHDLTWEPFVRSFGQRNDTALCAMLNIALSATQVERISDAKEERFRHLVRTEGLQLLPGVAVALTASQAAGWRQGLVTSAPRSNVETMLAVLNRGTFFEVVVTGDDVTRGKPDPSPFLMAANDLGAAPARCIVVEDSPAGIEAANRAGMRSVAVGPMHASLPATLSAASLADLPSDVFEALLAS